MKGRWGAAHEGVVLTKYLLAARQSFGEADVISLAFDAAAVGDRSCVQGLVLARGPGSSEHLAAWTPPQ
eukprot:3760124-Alexandrium_andersonii.AAC.1